MPADLIELKKDVSARELTFVAMELDRQKRNPMAMWLYWLFLGDFGGHRYYLGDKWRGLGHTIGFVLAYVIGFSLVASADSVEDMAFAGIAMLLFFWGPGIWALIDAFFIGRRLMEKNAEIEIGIIERVRALRSVADANAQSQS